MSESNFEKRTNFEKRVQWVYDTRAFPVWNTSFAKEERTDMIRDDLWRDGASRFCWRRSWRSA